MDLVHSRISSLENLRLGRFADHLHRLCLRQNFISHLDPEVFSLLTKLEELDLYDNKIKTVGDALNAMSKLTCATFTDGHKCTLETNAISSVLDLSFNLLKAVPDTLHHLRSLKTVYFVQNRISSITGLLALGSTLRSLELGGNKIRVCTLNCESRCYLGASNLHTAHRGLGFFGEFGRAVAREKQNNEARGAIPPSCLAPLT